MNAHVRVQIDAFNGDTSGAKHRLGDLIRLAREGDHRAVVISIAAHIEQGGRGRTDRIDQLSDYVCAPSLAEIGDAFDQRHA